MSDEIWTTRDGREISVGEMDEEHVRNVLRMLLRKTRKIRERRLAQLIEKTDGLPLDESFYERPDNRQLLVDLRRQHGDAVRVEPKGAAGMSGGNVYVNDEWVGWFGGI